MKKNRFTTAALWILSFVILVSSGQYLYAAQTVFIGKVDLKALILLHPAMRSYDPYIQAFKVDASKVSPAIIKQKAEEQESELAKLRADSRLIQGRIHELKKRFNREMDKLANNYLDGLETLATGPAALKRKTYLINKNRAETAHFAKLKSYNAQLTQIEERISKLEKITYQVGYTDPEETQKQFNAILNEVRQYTQKIANQKGIQVVLNSRSRELKSIRQDNQILGADLNYDKVFRMPFPNEIRNDSAAISGYYQNLSSMAATWLMEGNKILQPFSNQIIDNDIFIGGTDLTAEVLSAIFRSYKIDQNIGNALIQAIYTNN
ncbi:MAG: hypothetical protein Kow0029_23120 [Candidatus Rifleibacteriota bacterium]